MKRKAEILYEWSASQEIIDYDAEKCRKRGLKIILPTVLIVLVVEMSLFIPVVMIIQKCGSEATELIPIILKSFVFTGLFATGIILFIYIFDPMWQKRKKIYYQITSDALMIKTDSIRKIPWKKTKFINVCPHESLPEQQLLRLFNRKFIISIPLPKSELSEKVISFVSDKLESIKDKSIINKIIISRKQKAVLLISTGFYIACVLWTLHTFKYHIFNENIAPLFFSLFIYMPLFVGPGTLGMLFFYRTLFWKRKDLKQHAMFYNLVAFLSIPCAGFSLWLLDTYLNLTQAITGL